MNIIDIETGPLPDEQLALVKPIFEAPANYKSAEAISSYKAEAELKWKDRAALSPLTGQILVVGMDSQGQEQILTGEEPGILKEVWAAWNDGNRFAGFNVKEFDFRFMEIRSRILNIAVPIDLHEGRYWNRRIVDLQEIFCGYSRDLAGYSLAAICRACGLPGKLPGVSGADFARVFAEDRPLALSYLRADLTATAALAERLGIV